ncbi:SagB family peptide dehydrogenase [Nakamurella aerolata]|uniref:SagB/ThcOx family dehydrogenase n=1 Tax=Nakamurella aerolata TaxID=1656892 RepID=A0A849AG58_9ACTN|nr:SagB family peptide dehydrogenase [Nakamurella aerolata]NNG37440.1 SagB/ThcOx family dehydrogenase [Nakamurella aerolata]
MTSTQTDPVVDSGRAGPDAALVHRLRDGVTVQPGNGRWRVGSDSTGWLGVDGTAPPAAAVLTALQQPGVTEPELTGRVLAAHDENALLGMHLLLARLGAAGLLEHAVADRTGAAQATLVVAGRGPATLAAVPGADERLALADNVSITAVDGNFHAAVPRHHLAVRLAPRWGAVLPQLQQPRSAQELLGLLSEQPAAEVDRAALLGLLRLARTAGLVTVAAAEPAASPAPAESLRQWEFADIWMHSRSRSPRTVAGYGGTYTGRGRRQPEPAVRPSFDGATVPLPTPDLEQLRATDPSLTDVIERRRSWRTQDPDHPLTVGQLGELLYRTQRLRRTFRDGAGAEVADRPYPSGGASHELEIYPLITNVTGINPGLWHYDSSRHRLQLVRAEHGALTGLVARARAAAVMRTDPQVVLLVTARFGRVMFKYQSIAYPLILKHVGVLYQTLSLAATAMRLSLCPLGGGDADLFAAASGIDYYTEGTVGELVLGSRPVGAGDVDTDWTGEAGSGQGPATAAGGPSS